MHWKMTYMLHVSLQIVSNYYDYILKVSYYYDCILKVQRNTAKNTDTWVTGEIFLQVTSRMYKKFT